MRVIKAFAVLAACFGLFLLSARLLLNYKATCAQPCKELGTEPDPKPPHRTSETLYKPKCSPVVLKLELARPEFRVNTNYGLWYRLTLTNVCCGALDIDARSFRDGIVADKNHENDEDLYFRIWGPDGKELIPNFWVADTPNEFYPFIPYRLDTKGFTDDQMTVDLEPGESVRSTQAVLDPHVGVDIFLPHGIGDEDPNSPTIKEIRRQGLLFREEEIRRHKPPKPPAPPPGFRTLDGYYRFKHPGTYKIQAVFHDKVTWIGSVFPFWQALPRRAKTALYYTEDFIGVRLRPPYEGRDYWVKAESEILEFTVRP